MFYEYIIPFKKLLCGINTAIFLAHMVKGLARRFETTTSTGKSKARLCLWTPSFVRSH